MPQDEDKIAEMLQEINTRLGRIEENQKTMLDTLNEFRDAYREQQVQLLDHERRIDRLERGGQDYLVDFWLNPV